MKIFKGIKRVTTNLLVIGSIMGLLAPAAVYASLVSGMATITIDNAAVISSNAANYYFDTHWGASDNHLTIDSGTAGGTALSSAGATALMFPVNTNITTIVNGSRTLHATTMDASDTSTGQIGLSGALRMSEVNATPADGYLAPQDFYMAKTANVWEIVAPFTGFGDAKLFTLANVSESVNGNGELLLTGDLYWATAGLSWALVTGADANTQIGSFSLTPSAVPVPAAVWMFASGLIGLVASSRRKV